MEIDDQAERLAFLPAPERARNIYRRARKGDDFATFAVVRPTLARMKH